MQYNKGFSSVLLVVLIVGASASSVLAQPSQSVLYVPLIGLTSVPEPLALPSGAGFVTYNYAVKNFLSDIALTDITVVDDTCNDVKFANGDDNGDNKLDNSETWRYTCTTRLSKTTQSVATATGRAHDITATHRAYATVLVGLKDPPPLVSIINVTKVAYPLSLPIEGGQITFTYKVNNPGVVPLNNVTVTDNKCRDMSGKLGDINGNNLLDTNEVWLYTCTAHLKETTTNTVHVTAFANGQKAFDDTSITVKVALPDGEVAPSFPETGEGSSAKNTVWKILSGVLLVLVIVYILTRRIGQAKKPKKPHYFRRL